ncbi:CdaR family protein [Tenacibaculum ovolyticum]|uniref:CdaR family protein n=1 Tax=Tenacibaculum ovolyticum TaxID=104270 RepID=UPI003BAAA5E6
MKKTFNIPKTFFGFLTASILFWLLINLSKEYTTQINFDLVYTNLPIKKTIIETPIKQIPLLVKGSGFNLISTSISNNLIELDLEKINKKRGIKYYFLTKKLHSEIKEQLKSGIKLTEIKTDTIPLKIGTLSSKKVPLKTDLNITFQLGHDFSKSTSVKPDSVLISGEESLLKNITFLKLDKINLKNISESSKIITNILKPKDIKTNITSAEVSISVDKFTEGEIEVPVLVKNAPKGLNIYPKKVKIIYKIGLKNFNKINENSFKIECDYNKVKNSEVSYLIPKFKKSPDIITLIRIVPEKIDFLIHK